MDKKYFMRVKHNVIDHSPWLSLALLEELDILGIMLLCNEALKVDVSIVWGGSVSLIGEGNGTPLQYSFLENPMDRGAWWAAVHGVARVRHD